MKYTHIHFNLKNTNVSGRIAIFPFKKLKPEKISIEIANGRFTFDTILIINIKIIRIIL
jgi:hypothetical protein